MGATVTATRGTSNRSGAKKKPAARASSKRPPAKKAAASSRSRQAPATPPFTVRLAESVAHASRGHGADFAGIVLIVLGLVAAMGVYADAGGPVGRGTADLVGFVVGAARVLVPILLIVLGALLVRGAPLPKEADPDDPTVVDVDPQAAEHPFARNVFGGVLLAIAGLEAALGFFQAYAEGTDATARGANRSGASTGVVLSGHTSWQMSQPKTQVPIPARMSGGISPPVVKLARSTSARAAKSLSMRSLPTTSIGG